MTSFRVRCECGEVFRTDEQNLGRRIHCRQCGRDLVVRRPLVALGTTPTGAPRAHRKRRAPTRSFRRFFTGAFRARSRDDFDASGLARPAAVVCWAYAVGAAAVALFMWALGDAWWPATAVLFSGRWIFLLPLALLVPAALLLRRPRLVVPLLLGALIVVGPMMGFRTGWQRWLPGAASGTPFRVVTFNADVGDWLVPQLSFLVTQWRADVIAFQECGPELAKAMTALPGRYGHVAEGLCLSSRYPIREASSMDRSSLDRVRQGNEGIGGAGFVTRYVLDTPRGPVDFTNVHLETPRKGFEGLLGGRPSGADVRRLRDNTTLRDIESSLARRWVAGRHDPTIVAGDFNTPVESRIFRRNWGDLTDAFSRAGAGFGMTKYNGWIRARIDHVLSGPEWRADRAVVGPDLGSDHRPLIVDLTLLPRKR